MRILLIPGSIPQKEMGEKHHTTNYTNFTKSNISINFEVVSHRMSLDKPSQNSFEEIQAGLKGRKATDPSVSSG